MKKNIEDDIRVIVSPAYAKKVKNKFLGPPARVLREVTEFIKKKYNVGE